MIFVWLSYFFTLSMQLSTIWCRNTLPSALEVLLDPDSARTIANYKTGPLRQNHPMIAKRYCTFMQPCSRNPTNQRTCLIKEMFMHAPLPMLGDHALCTVVVLPYGCPNARKPFSGGVEHFPRGPFPAHRALRSVVYRDGLKNGPQVARIFQTGWCRSGNQQQG